MKKNCVVNASYGGWYPLGLERMRGSLQHHGFDGDCLGWVNKFPAGCPAHEVIPYAFKPLVMRVAMNSGYENVLWLDSSVWAIRNPAPIFDYIANIGPALWVQGDQLGEWASDASIEKFGITRECAMAIPLLQGGIWGFNTARDRDLVEQYCAYALDGVTFPGPWWNHDHTWRGRHCPAGLASADPRVRGHRHDMVPLSFIAEVNQLPRQTNLQFAYWTERPDESTIFLARGM